LSAGNGTITLAAGNVADADGNADISASAADITAAAFGDGTDSINTAAADLTVDTSASNGDQYIAQTDAITALNLSAGNGTITLDAGNVTDADGNADISASAADITAAAFGDGTDSINTAAADLTIDTSASNGDQYIAQTDPITALNLSAGNGTITLTAGGITDADGDADISASVADITAAAFGDGTDSINTAAADLTVNTSAANGDQYIAQTGAITALDLDAGNGNITLSADSVTDTDTAADLSNTALVSLTAPAIGAASEPIALDGATQLEITDTGAGDIFVTELNASTIGSTDVTVGAIDYGNINITYNNTDSVNIGDDHFLDNIDLDLGASSFSYTATTGNITVGSVDVGSGQSASITALAGAIDDASSGDSVTDITADTVDLNADTGIGNSEELELAAGTITADNSTSGNVVIDNTLAGAVTVNTLTTAGGGNIDFQNTGAGGVSFGTVSTSDDGGGVAGENDITLSSNGGNLTVSTSVTADDAGVITYNTNTSGNVILTGTTTAADDLVSINSAGSINGTGLVTAGAANLTAPAGIGNIWALDLAGVTNLTLDTDAGFNVSTDVDLRDLTLTIDPAGGLETYSLADSGNLSWDVTDDAVDADLNLADLSVGAGDLNLDLTTDNGNINVGTVGAGAGTVSLTASAGSLTDATSSITAGDLTLTADALDRSIGAAGNELNLTLSGTLTANASNGSGGIFVDETDDMSIAAVDAGSGTVELHSDGSINDATDDTDTDISGNTAILTAQDEIGGGIATKTVDNAGALETDVTNLVAHSTNAGDIVITENDAITLSDVDTIDGAITITAGGAVVAADVAADGDGDTDDVTLTANNTGDITIGLVSADGQGDVTMEAADGAINDGTVDTSTDIRADVVELTAADGIGQTQAIETEADTISAETTNNGANIDIDNVSAAANVEIMGLTTPGGTINFDQTGGAVLRIAAAGSGIDSGDGGSINGGDITVNGSDGIVVNQAITSASGSGGAINIGGGVQINADITAGNGAINLNRSTGFGQGDIILSSQLNSTGNMNLTTSTGGVRVTTTGRIDAGGEAGLYGNNLIINPGVAVEIQSGGPDVMVEAGGNITIQDVSYDPWAPAGEDIVISGPITSTGGGVKIIGGAIYTEGAGGELNVPITGYSDGSTGVSFPYSGGGRAAITLWSLLDDLKLGSDAELTANGFSSAVDERSNIYFTTFGATAGDPVDVGIYLWCFNLSNLINPAHVLTVNSNNISSSAGAVVFDAGNSVYFGNNFETYLAGAPDISRIEVVSRIASSLNDVVGPAQPDLPHAGEEMVFWNLLEGPEKGYILRGDFYSSIIGWAFVLDYIEPIPVISFGLEPPEIEPGEVEAVDLEELLAWLESEFGEDAKTYFAGAYNNEYSTDMLPIKSAVRLRELSRILGDYENYIAALTQVVNEFVPDPEMPPSDEQFDAASQVIALHFEADDGTHYAVAGQWLNAISEYFSILTNVTGTGNYPQYTEIGWDADRALLQHILPRYFAGAQESVVGYIGTYILGGS
ncbi:MAG TPA: hypothetical protein HPP87_06945, partial [Planctomycetes bacterium]|nr:hypothetical protein [Planctomycetota bacterium]